MFSFLHESVISRQSCVVGILTILFVMLTTDSLVAQSSDATLRVVITSADDGSPIVNANILLTGPEGDTLHAGASDRDGINEFSDIAPQTYHINISYIGYQRYRETVTLEAGETRIHEASLQTETVQIDELTVGVRSGAVRREAGKQTITANDINLVPAPGGGGDLSSYLQTQPGVVTSGDKGGEFYIRGGTPSQNLVLLDNMPIVKPFHISNLYSAFPQEVINSVDFYAGGFGAEYAGAASSVLDVNLKQGNLKEFESSASVSPYLTSIQAEGPIVEDKSSILLVGRRSVIEQTAPSLTGKEVPLVFGDIIARYSMNWSGLSCNITGLYTQDQGQINPERDLRLEWSNTAAGIRCLGYGEELDHTLDITMGYSGFSSSETGIDDLGRTSGLNKGFLQLDNGGTFWGMDFEYGFRWNLNFYSATLYEPFPELRDEEVRYPGLDSSLDEFESILNGYISVTWEPFDHLTITPGLTSQNRHADMALTFEPRLRASWHPGGSDRQEITLSGGRYIQMMEGITDERDAGTVFYVYKPVDRDEPMPEAWHGIVGYHQMIGESVEVSIEGYGKKLSNFLVSKWTQQPGNTIRTTKAEGLIYGGDLQLEFNQYPFYLSVGYGWSEITYKLPTSEVAAWREESTFTYSPSHDLRHQLNVIASYNVAGFTANASWRFNSGRPYTRLFALDFALEDLPDQNVLEDRGTAKSLYSKPFDGRLPSFHRLDVSVSRSFDLSPALSLETEVGAINAYDIRNVFYFDINTFEQVNQTPLLPYASIRANINK